MTHFDCDCGKRLQVADDKVGKKVRCPGCGQVVEVPGVADAMTPTEQGAGESPKMPQIKSWLYPPKHENFLVALDEENFWAYSQVFTSVRPAHEQLEAQGNPQETLGKDALRISIAKIQKLELDKKRANLVVYYHAKDKNDNWAEYSKEFFFENEEIRDAVVDAIRDRLGEGWSIREEQLSALRGALPYLFVFFLTLLAVPVLIFAFHWLQGDYLLDEMQGRLFFNIAKAIIHFVQDILKMLGIVIDIIIYGAAVLLCIAWTVLLISHVRMPPLLWHLEKSKPSE